MKMKLTEVLKRAIETKDWELVCKVYTGITGEPISPPKPKTEAEMLAGMDIDLEAEAQKVREEITQEIVDKKQEQAKRWVPEPPPEPTLSEEYNLGNVDAGFTGNPNIKVRKAPISNTGRKNLFVDDGTIAPDEMKENDETGLDQMYKQTYSPRRPEAQLIDMTCTQCSKVVKVPPVLAVGRTSDSRSDETTNSLFRCETCSRGGK
jgi:hypothetical protein